MAFWNKLRDAFRAEAAPFVPQGVPGARAYAVGDIHGRLDRLDEMLALIEADRAAAPPCPTLIAFLGDYVDRGPHSAGVIERLSTFRPDGAQAVFLAGNHEEALLHTLEGYPGVLRNWLRFGGDACAESYGLSEDELVRAGELEAAAMLGRALPPAHLRFLRGLRETHVFGDYLFVHAGIRPGVALDRQKAADLRWIREPFLSHTAHHGVMVVHGHTIVERAQEHANRIAIDTGAYRSGELTALVIEGERRRFLATARD